MRGSLPPAHPRNTIVADSDTPDVIARLTLALLVAAALTACGSSAPDTPPYTLVSDADSTFMVEVDTLPDEQGLRNIFDAIRSEAHEDGGYFVYIDCSTGGTTMVANRLATGRFPVGERGEIQLGMTEGEAEFEVQPDRQCPAPDRPDNGEVTPERQPFLDAMKAIDPGLVEKPPVALSRARSSCHDLEQGVSRADVVERTAYRYNSPSVPVDEATGEMILAAIEDTEVCGTFEAAN